MSARQRWPWPENLYRRLLFCPPTTMPTGCIEFTGARTSNGYGKVTRDRRSVLAHRAMYELLVGPIPPDREPDHLCRNRACVNVGHLELVTHQENLRRGDHVNRRKTHCPRGHPYDRIWGGWRRCSVCEAEGRRRREIAREQIAHGTKGASNG